MTLTKREIETLMSDFRNQISVARQKGDYKTGEDYRHQLRLLEVAHAGRAKQKRGYRTYSTALVIALVACLLVFAGPATVRLAAADDGGDSGGSDKGGGGGDGGNSDHGDNNSGDNSDNGKDSMQDTTEVNPTEPESQPANPTEPATQPIDPTQPPTTPPACPEGQTSCN